MVDTFPGKIQSCIVSSLPGPGAVRLSLSVARFLPNTRVIFEFIYERLLETTTAATHVAEAMAPMLPVLLLWLGMLRCAVAMKTQSQVYTHEFVNTTVELDKVKTKAAQLQHTGPGRKPGEQGGGNGHGGHQGVNVQGQQQQAGNVHHAHTEQGKPAPAGPPVRTVGRANRQPQGNGQQGYHQGPKLPGLPEQEDDFDGGIDHNPNGGGGNGHSGHPEAPKEQGTDNTKRGGCFPPTAFVSIRPSTEIQLANLEASQLLLLPSAAGGEVSSTEFLQDFHGHQPDQLSRLVRYLVIRHRLQKPGRPLIMTAGHLLFRSAGGGRHAVAAGDVRAGDRLLALAGPGGELAPSEVLDVQEVDLPGYSAPFTTAGELVVEGVLVSCYAFPSPAEVGIDVRAYAPVALLRRWHEVSHLLALPHRVQHCLRAHLKEASPALMRALAGARGAGAALHRAMRAWLGF